MYCNSRSSKNGRIVKVLGVLRVVVMIEVAEVIVVVAVVAARDGGPLYAQLTGGAGRVSGSAHTPSRCSSMRSPGGMRVFAIYVYTV